MSGSSVVRLGTPGLEIADLALRIFVADGIAGLQLADQDLATTVELLDVIVGQFSPPLLGLALSLVQAPLVLARARSASCCTVVAVGCP